MLAFYIFLLLELYVTLFRIDVYEFNNDVRAFSIFTIFSVDSLQ